jgi:hypothetical protein
LHRRSRQLGGWLVPIEDQTAGTAKVDPGPKRQVAERMGTLLIPTDRRMRVKAGGAEILAKGKIRTFCI